MSGGRHGATHDLAQRGVSRSGRESVMAVDRFCRNAVGPPEWECEAMGSVVWVKCASSAECILNLSVAAPADKRPVRSRSHYGSIVTTIMCLKQPRFDDETSWICDCQRITVVSSIPSCWLFVMLCESQG